jgi:hypothetical protein
MASKQGTALALSKQHPNATASQIVELARKDGVILKPHDVGNARHRLRDKRKAVKEKPVVARNAVVTKDTNPDINKLRQSNRLLRDLLMRLLMELSDEN